MHLYFIGGIHGSGKTTLCKHLSASLNVPHYSAGELINMGGVKQEARQKFVCDVAQNQRLLLHAVDELRHTGTPALLLDGHYTVVDVEGNICLIDVEVFRGLQPTALVLLDTEPGEIVRRLRDRDEAEYNLTFVQDHACAEKSHAAVVSGLLRSPLLLLSNFNNADDLGRRLVSLDATREGA